MAEPRRGEVLLASASPFRRRMLEAAGLSFRVVPADVDEPAIRQRIAIADLARVATTLAEAKAVAVSEAYPDALVIGADQVLAIDDKLFNKPKDLDEARAQLKELRGKAHHLHTAAALAQAGKILWSHTETARLIMRSFSDAFLDRYLAEMGARVCHTVGAYEIEGCGIQLFERVEGDSFTIIGLPLLPLLAELRARGAIDT
jgi:nucleoside triphosphate pyrophosphatase